MKKLPHIALFAVILLFLAINIFTLNDGHNWGDDFAQYIQHAVNLVEHKPYDSHIAVDLWVVVPPGFPLILSSVIYWCGVNFKILKMLNIVFWALTAAVTYGITLKRLGRLWAVTLSTWLLSLPFFFYFKQNVLSDIPFMCFVMLAIWMFEKYEQTDKRIFLVATLFLMGYAALIRWAGLGLFLAVFLYLSIIKGQWRRSLVFMLAGVISVMIAGMFGVFSSPDSGPRILSAKEWALASWQNSGYVLNTALELIFPNSTPLTHAIFPFALVTLEIIAPWVILCLGGYFIYRMSHKQMSFTECFVFLYFFGVCLWPVQGGARYLLPILIPTLILTIQSLTTPLKKAALIILFFLIAHNGITVAQNIRFNDDDIYKKESLEMMQWVQSHLSSEDHFMFNKPRALGLMTKRLGAPFWLRAQDKDEWYRRIRPLEIDYLVTDKILDPISQYDQLKLMEGPDALYLNKVWENARYKVLKVSLSGH